MRRQVCVLIPPKKILFLLFISGVVLFFIYQHFTSSNVVLNKESKRDVDGGLMSFENNRLRLQSDVHAYYEKRKHWTTSNLGSILFKNNVQQYYSSKNKTFVILIWRYWSWLKVRHLGDREGNPFETCSVKNCRVTGNDDEISTADAVVIHAQHGVLPSNRGRRSSQRWVILSDESPINTFSLAGKRPSLSTWANVFNWTMTYRSDSDVPVPYGRTVPLRDSLILSETTGSLTDLIPFWDLKQKDVLATALISHCRVAKRMNYISELQKYLDVDVYGKCSEKNLSCPGHFKEDCPVINKFIFYLAFENTRCRQYLTEKIFYNAYSKGAIPIIMGPSKEDCDHLLPPHSYLHVDNYPNPKALVEEMKDIVKNQENLLMYHQWRRHYELRNEHGFFKTKSYHLCRICEALNYNDPKPKVYGEDELKMFFEPKLLCDLPNL